MIDFAAAFATFAATSTRDEPGPILLGRDPRKSSGMIRSAVLAGLLAEGCDVIDHGICPTPMLQFAVANTGAGGAVSISGGHTDMGWNAMTLIGRDGAFLDPVGGENVLDFYHASDFTRPDWSGMGTLNHAPTDPAEAAAPYFDALEALVDAPTIRGAKLTVVIDPVGGAGCPFLDEFAKRFGLGLIPVNATPSAYLPRDPEPRPRTAKPLTTFVTHLGADAAFVLSSDMGRLSLVTETGEPVSEEYTFPLIANHVLTRHPGPIVTNHCTTRTLDDVARYRQCRVHKTHVGQAHILSAVANEEAVIGGEGNGSVALPEFSQAFDGFLMMALILEAMALNDCPLSDLVSALPRYHIQKRETLLSSQLAHRALEQLRLHLAAEFPQGTITRDDGFRLDTPDFWLHARISKTEQAIRVITEAADRQLAEHQADDAIRQLDSSMR